MYCRSRLSQVTVLSSLLIAFGTVGSLTADEIDFDKQIRPIFQDKCHECHGPDTQEAGLRLDLKTFAFDGGDSGAVIVPGKSDESKLIKLISGEDPEVKMPPGEDLSTDDIDLLKNWIDAGADWPDDPESANNVASNHWSFQPIKRPQVPGVPQHSQEWVRNPIDAFVLAKLVQRGIEPSPEADRATLIRRLYLDLLGLLPRPEEVEEFVSDRSPDAYEKLVERLLASPHFGERWGRHWLDLARYADSDGYEKDRVRPHAWRWRDWVINSFNQDQPFDEFTIEQLAGDMLPNATLDQKIATGFHRNTLTNTEGGVDQEEYRIKATVDRVSTTGAVWLGLTVGCAECHSHKYDPLSQREFYQMFAYFNSVDEVNIPAPTSEDQTRYNEQIAKHKLQEEVLKQDLALYRAGEFQTSLKTWLTRVGQSDVSWNKLALSEFESEKGVEFTPQDDGSYLVGGSNPDKATYSFLTDASQKAITAIRLDVLPDDSLPAKGPGRVKHGNLVLSQFQAFVVGDDSEKPQPLNFARADATYWQSAGSEQEFHPKYALVAGNPKRGWAVASQYGKENSTAFEFEHPLSLKPGQRLKIVMEQQYGQQHTIGRFRLSTTAAPVPVSLQPVPEKVQQLLTKESENYTDKQRQAVEKFYESLDAGIQTRKKQLDEHRAATPKLTDHQARTLLEREKPRTTQVLLRGDFLNPGAEVKPGTPRVLNELKTDNRKNNRLEFARWLVAPENPLTRRVEVNRIWKQLFGEGLVRTTEDFGTRGELPSHPELLDWLAAEFLERSWSRKEIIRLIVNSRTYRQASRVREELGEIDPLNYLLARQNRYRLEGEVIRDLFLDASGLLNEAVGGPSIRPPLPPGVRELGYANSVKWQESEGDEKYRRGCYIFFQRTVPYPMLMTFDSPDSNVTCTRRERSNTPLQSLTLLNSPVFFECAVKLGSEYSAKGDMKDRERIAELFRRCVGRVPTSSETKILLDLLGDYRNLATAADAEEQTEMSPEVRAWVGVARIVMNLDEFMTRE